jgi:hypothetical protein
MGDFALTCCASSLPIEGGDAVMALLVTGLGAGWAVRSPAVRGVYDGYGRVVELENTATARAIQGAWASVLSSDLILPADDRASPAYTSGMTVAAFLYAMGENRNGEPPYVVSPHSPSPEADLRKTRMAKLKHRVSPIEHPSPLPDLYEPYPHRVRAVLPVEFHLAVTAAWGGRCARVVATERTPPRIWGAVEAALRAVDFGCILIPPMVEGRNVGTSVEMLVFPAIPTRGPHPGRRFTKVPNDPPAPLGVAVIRADVWDGLLTLPGPAWMRGETLSALRERHLAAMERRRPAAVLDPHPRRLFGVSCDWDDPGMPFFNESGGYSGMSTHAMHLVARADWSAEVCAHLTDQSWVMELLHVNRRGVVAMQTGGHAEWADHARYSALVHEVADTRKRVRAFDSLLAEDPADEGTS